MAQIASTAGGIVLGAGLAIAMTQATTRPAPTSSRAPEEPHLVAAAPGGARDLALAARLSELDAKVAALAAAPRPTSSSTAVPDEDGVAAVSAAVFEARHAQFIEDHKQEVRNAAWAPQSEQTLTSGLNDLGARGGGAQVTRVDCKTRTCVATVKWPDAKAAEQNYARLLTGSIEPNCARSILVSDESLQAGESEYALLLDCSQAVNGI